MKRHLIENNKIVKTVVLGQASEASLYLIEEGWVDEVIPEINRHFEFLGEPYYDVALQKVTYPVMVSDVPNLEQLKNQHFLDLENVMKEISDIVTLYKNINDPFSNTPENISQEFSQLMLQSIGLKNRAIQEINSLETREDAVNYVIRGPEVINYIAMLKSFIN